MESITNTDYDSPTPKKRRGNSRELPAKAAGSAPKSKKRSRSGREKEGTKPAGSKRQDSEIGLSILQAGFDQALDEGVVAKVLCFPPNATDTHHRIMIQVWNAAICPNCQAWTEQTKCPACGNQIG